MRTDPFRELDRITQQVLGAVGFLAWVLVKTLSTAPPAQIWSLIGVVVAGLVVMAAVRIILRPVFFSLSREADASKH